MLVAACTVLVGVILIPFFSSLLAEEVQFFLKTYLGDYFLHGITGALTICAFILFFIYFYDKTNATDVIAHEDPDSRKQLIQNLRQLYKDRFTEKMKGDLGLDINLQLKYTTTGTSPERVKKFYAIKEDTLTTDFDSLFEDYIRKINRLLILGEPGSGKSILLLRFGLKLTEEAEKDKNFPVPAILDLATWNKDDQTFENWLEQNLPYIAGSFAISKEESRRLVENNTLLLLLDGFDEIQEQYRNSCFEKLQTYLRKLKNSRKETFPEVILCSRVSEYLSADDAPVSATVEIQTLQPENVQVILESLMANNHEPAIELQRDLNNNAYLYTAITSAFYLHILLNIYTHEKTPFFTSNSKELLQKEIIETYTRLEIEKLTDYPFDKAKKWLGWLAWKMKNTSGIVAFELIYLQPIWSTKIVNYNLSMSVIGGLFIGLTGGLVLATTTITEYDLENIQDIELFYLFFILASGLFFSLISTLCLVLSKTFFYLNNKDKTKIATIEIQEVKLKNFNFRKFKKAWIEHAINSLIYGYPFLFLLIFISLSFDTGRWTVASIIDVFVLSLLIILSFGLCLSFFYALFSAFTSEKSLPKINNPYQRLLAQFWRDFFRITIIFVLTLLILNRNSELLYAALLFGLLFGLWVTVISSPILKHLCLRVSLFLETVVPLKLVTFLNYVSVNSGLLIRDGGQWRFRHQLILDSLANSFEGTYSHLLKPEKKEKIL